MSIIDWFKKAGSWISNNVLKPVGAGLMTGIGWVGKTLSPAYKFITGAAIDTVTGSIPLVGRNIGDLVKKGANALPDAMSKWGRSYDENLKTL